MTVALATLFSEKGIGIVPIYTPNPYHTDPFSDYISD